MNPISPIVTFLAIAVFAVGCSKETTASKQIDKVQAKTEEAAQDLKEYSYAQKAQFVESMQAQLKALDQEMDQIAVKLEKSNEKTKAELQPKLQALREQNAKLNKQLDEVRHSSESTWDSVKTGARKAFEEVKDGVNQARQWVSDKIAP